MGTLRSFSFSFSMWLGIGFRIRGRIGGRLGKDWG